MDGRISVSLNRSPSCQTQSNACSTSKKTEGQTFFKPREVGTMSISLFDDKVEGANAELAIGDRIGYEWEKSLEE